MKQIVTMAMFLAFMACASFANALTSEEAIIVLDSASSQAALTRKGHSLVIESVNLLRSRLKELNNELNAKKNKDADDSTIDRIIGTPLGNYIE